MGKRSELLVKVKELLPPIKMTFSPVSCKLTVAAASILKTTIQRTKAKSVCSGKLGS